MNNFIINKVSFLPYIRTQKASKTGESTVYIAIKCNGATYPLNIGIRGTAKDWNKKTKEFRGDQYYVINKKLSQIKMTLEGIEYDLSRTNETVTAYKIAETYKKMLDSKTEKKDTKPNLLKVLDMYLNKEIGLGRKHQTVKNLNTYKRNLIDFLKSTKKLTIKCQDFDVEQAEEFHLFMHQKGISDNHTNRILGLVKRLLDYAVTRKYLPFNPLQSVKFKYKDKVNTTSLEKSDIEKLINQTLPPRLQKVTDIYLFMCGTGIDHCDYIRLTNEDFCIEDGLYCVKQARLKSNSEANPVMLDFAVKILEKYGTINDLPKCSLTELNREIKEVAKVVGISMKLTSKVARKTFANYYANMAGVSDETLAYMMGHTTTKHLKHYRKTKHNRVLSELMKVNDNQVLRPKI